MSIGFGTKRLSDRGYELILKFEVGGGPAYYNKYLRGPLKECRVKDIIPGADSGITVGIGFDLGFHTVDEIEENWTFAGIHEATIALMTLAAGKTKLAAKRILPRLGAVEIPWDNAWKQFNERTLPTFIRKTISAFPEAHKKLSADGFAALVSLTFNRGPRLEDMPKGLTRQHMRDIRKWTDTMPAGPLLDQAVAQSLRDMKALWNPRKSSGLHKRREAEARLVLGIDS